MSAVIEVRTYRAKPLMRGPLLDLLRSRAFPLQRELGMKILGPFPSQEDDDTFVWLRGFPDEASRAPLKAAFYDGPDWLGGLEASILPMLDNYAAEVVQDTSGLWSRRGDRHCCRRSTRKQASPRKRLRRAERGQVRPRMLARPTVHTTEYLTKSCHHFAAQK